MKTQRIPRVVLGALLGASLAASAASVVSGATIWPASSAWQPVMVGSNVYVDPAYSSGSDYYATPPSPAALDIVGGIGSGGASYAAGYYCVDGAQNLILFRMRTNAQVNLSAQGGDKYVWSVLLNTDGGVSGDVNWALQVDNNSDHDVELVQAVSGGPNTGNPWNPVVLSGTPAAAYAISSDNTEVVSADDSDAGLAWHSDSASNTDDSDWFLDMAFPLDQFESITGWSPAAGTLGVAFATSSDPVNLNKDLPDYAGFGQGAGVVLASSALLPPGANVPEPATAVLLTFGVAGIVTYVRRRRPAA